MFKELKYMQLFRELETRIHNGSLKQGSRLPSVRTLAAQFGCSNSTAIAALAELERLHLIYAVPRSGYYVVQTSAKREDDSVRPVDFSASAPDPDLFPYLDFQHCINKAIDTYKNDLFTYGTSQGLPSLLTVLKKQLASSQVFTTERNIVITSGVQQALALLSALPFPNGRQTVLIEQPTYHLFIQHLLVRHIPVKGITRTAAGLDMEELEGLFRAGDIKFFYMIPRFHLPLGTSYTAAQKKEILALAHKYDVYIVEDDYMADLELDTKADPLHAMDLNERVIYLKSFSKIIFPGLRVGVTVLPEPLVDAFTLIKRTWDIDSSMLSQGALEIYLKSGMFERHRQKIRDSYAKRARVMAQVLEEEAIRSDGAFSYTAPRYPSILTHLVLDERLSPARIIRQLQKQSVVLDPIDKHFLPGHARKHLLKLNATTVPEPDIEIGIRRLGEEIRRQFTTS